jgi:uncharacterized protein (TIGR02996 family)
VTLTDGDRLLAAIREQPDRDDYRLIYADWLEEHGQEERAEFIRVQVELASGNDHGGGKKYASRRAFLRRREQELQLANRNGIEWRNGLVELIPDGKSEFSRGFISSLTCTLADLMAHAATLGSACPALSAVRLTDREPLDNSGPAPHDTEDGLQRGANHLLQWWGFDPNGREHRHRIPREIMLHLFQLVPKNRRWHRASQQTTNCFFETAEAALEMLSTAAALYCRQLATTPGG